MRRSVLAGFVCTAVLWASTLGQAQEQSKYTPLFEAVWSTVNDNFYDPSFHGVDWKKIGERYRGKLGTVATDVQFEKLAGDMLGELGTSHLYIVPPSLSSASGVGIGVRYRNIGNRKYVSLIAPFADARMRGLRVGDRIVSPAADLTGVPGSLASFRVESCSGKEYALSARRIGAFWPPPHPAFEWWQAKVGPKLTIGYIRIDRFDDAAQLADQAMDELKGTDGLIIDVRSNSGGNLSALRLSSYFSGKEQIGVALFAREYLKTLNHTVNKDDVLAAPRVKGVYTDESIFKAVNDNAGRAVFMTEDMGAKEYSKAVVVLIGEDTGSAGEGFAWTMQKMTSARIVGRKTAGELLSGDTFDLPGGWKLTVPVQGLWGGDGMDYGDRAVEPDIAVSWTRADLCSGRDPDLERAMSLLVQP